MAIDWLDVMAIAPELSAVADAGRAAFLSAVKLQLNADRWGERLDLASTYLAAHLGTLSLRSGNAGAIASEAVGPLNVSYFNPVMMGSGALQSTSWGQEFIMLRKRTMPHGAVL